MEYNMTMVDNEIVRVYETDKGEKIVDGRELHGVLESKQDFSTWIKKRIFESDAVADKDFSRFHKKMEANNATSIEYYLKLDIAKEIAMLERNEIGKKVRKHFIEIENRYKRQIIDRTQLSPQTQLMLAMSESIAKTELEQKRQAEQLQKLEDKTNKQTEVLQNVKDTFSNSDSEEDTTHWINKCINKIAESSNFSYSFGNRYSAARNESYDRLTLKAGCRLDQKVRNAIARAEEKGYTKNQINAINKLTVIMADKRLKEIYIGVIKEMMIAYCVEVA